MSGLLRDVVTNLFKAVRAFRGAMQVVLLSDGFWKGRQWRAYYEFSIPQNEVRTIRITATKAFLLQSQELYLDSGAVRAVVYTLPATAPGPWFGLTTRFNKNLLNGPTALSSTIEYSIALGSFTGGNEREVLRANAGGGNNAGAGHGSFGWRALPAGVYYIRLTGTGSGTSTGTYNVEIEELDS